MIWNRKPTAVLDVIIDVHMARINRKIERAGGWLRIFANGGKGYRLGDGRL